MCRRITKALVLFMGESLRQAEPDMKCNQTTDEHTQ